MIIEQAVRAQLLLSATLTALVGAEGVYYNKVPQDTSSPFIVLSKVSSPRDHTHDGSSHLANPRFQMTIYASTYKLTKDIAAAVQTALQGFSGLMGGAGGVSVNGCFYEDETDLGFETETNLYSLAVDYKLWCEE